MYGEMARQSILPVGCTLAQSLSNILPHTQSYTAADTQRCKLFPALLNIFVHFLSNIPDVLPLGIAAEAHFDIAFQNVVDKLVSRLPPILLRSVPLLCLEIDL